MPITVNAYMESLNNSGDRFRTLRKLYPVADATGFPSFFISGDFVVFNIIYKSANWNMFCPLFADGKLDKEPADNILNISNKNNPFIAACQLLRDEILVFDASCKAIWADVVICLQPNGISLPRFVRSNLFAADRKVFRTLLRNINTMADSLYSSDINHGDLKADNIIIKADSSLECADFAISAFKKQKSDTLQFAVMAATIFITGGEPALYIPLGERTAFAPATFSKHLRHIKTQAEFLKLNALADLVDTINTMFHEAACGFSERGRTNTAIRELAATPFTPMPLLIDLLASHSENGTILRRSVPSASPTHYSGEAPEDKTLHVDFSSCEYVGVISDTMIRFSLNGSWGYANRNGRRLETPGFIYAEDFFEGRAKVEMPEGCGLIDRHGKYIMEPVYEILEWYGEENIVGAARDGYWDLYDRNGRKITPRSYEWLGGGGEGRFIARRDGKYAYILADGRQLTGFRYDEAYSFRNGKALVVIGNDTFSIDSEGKKL